MYVLMDPNLLNQFLNPANAAYWRGFMQTYYEPLPVPGATTPILWKRKGTI
jgi:hypothetical protein